jgi:repressor LexA
MSPREFANLRRRELGLTQKQLAEKLKTTRVTVARYENGTRHIPGAIELLVRRLCRAEELPLAGTVAAGRPIEAIEEHESVEVPSSMAQRRDNFVLRVTGDSMRDDGILSGDFVVIRKQATAAPGERVIAIVNGEATLKRYYPSPGVIELRPMNRDMTPIFVKKTDFRIAGVVVGLIRHYR